MNPLRSVNVPTEIPVCRLMGLLAVTTGLRRSELLALKWSDVDFSDMRLDVLRSIYMRHIVDCKTEASRKPARQALLSSFVNPGEEGGKVSLSSHRNVFSWHRNGSRTLEADHSPLNCFWTLRPSALGLEC
jgi:integrase